MATQVYRIGQPKAAVKKLEYEVVWCVPARAAFVHHEPRPARFSDITHARAFAKLAPRHDGTFIVIRQAPVREAISLAAHLRTHTPPTPAECATFKWEVVGRSPDDYKQTHRLVEGEPRAGFVERSTAVACKEFVESMPNSLAPGLIIDIVPWDGARVWRDGLATVRNDFL